MGFSLLRIEEKNHNISWAYTESGAYLALPARAGSLAEFIKETAKEALIEARARLRAGEGASLEGVKILPPVTSPCQIICQGKNYLDHMIEMGTRPENKDYNILFTKADSALAAPSGELLRPSGVRLLDYEVELGLVLKRDLKPYEAFTERNISEIIAGLVMANDVSARDIQVTQRQWFKGKSFFGFCPVGPVFYWMEEEDFSKLLSLDLFLSVNGEKRQSANTAQLLYRPWETFTEIASLFSMRRGDLLLTGTPGGVAMRVKPKKWWEELVGALKQDKQKMREFVEGQLKSPRYLRDGDLIESWIKSKDGSIDLGMQKLRVRGH